MGAGCNDQLQEGAGSAAGLPEAVAAIRGLRAMVAAVVDPPGDTRSQIEGETIRSIRCRSSYFEPIYVTIGFASLLIMLILSDIYT